MEGKMKSALAIMLAASFATAALASSESSDAILRLLNSRSAGSPLRYAQAASVVAADAKRGLPLQQFVLAIIAGDPDAPSAARIPDEQRKAFLDCYDDAGNKAHWGNAWGLIRAYADFVTHTIGKDTKTKFERKFMKTTLSNKKFGGFLKKLEGVTGVKVA